MENDAIPMVLLVQNKFTFTPSENALIIIMNVPRSIRKPRKTSSLLHQVKARYNSYEYSSFYIPITQNKFAFTPSKRGVCKTRTGYLRMAYADGKMRMEKNADNKKSKKEKTRNADGKKKNKINKQTKGRNLSFK